ncbi:hypothetical protein AgCh_016865 [Apium graveolens]
MLRRDPRRTNLTPDRKSRNMENARNIAIRCTFIGKFLFWKVFPVHCLRYFLQFAILNCPPIAASLAKGSKRGLVETVQHLDTDKTSTDQSGHRTNNDQRRLAPQFAQKTYATHICLRVGNIHGVGRSSEESKRKQSQCVLVDRDEVFNPAMPNNELIFGEEDYDEYAIEDSKTSSNYSLQPCDLSDDDIDLKKKTFRS